MKSRCKLLVIAVAVFAGLILVPDAFGGPLHDAAKSGKIKEVRKLIDEGHRVNTRDLTYYNFTPLHYAVWNGHKDVVALLLDRGADTGARNEDGQMPLHLAALFDHKVVTELLLDKGADINAEDKWGLTPLYGAISCSYKEVAIFLLDRGADTKGQDKDEKTSLHWAAQYNDKDIVARLLDRGGDINATDRSGNTPLHYAVWKGHKDVVALLLDRGADIWVTGKGGGTLLHDAVSSGDTGVAAELLDWLLRFDESGGDMRKVVHEISVPGWDYKTKKMKLKSVWQLAADYPVVLLHPEVAKAIEERLRDPKKYAQHAYERAQERRMQDEERRQRAEIDKQERRRAEVEAQEVAGMDPGYAEAWIKGGDYVDVHYDI